MPPGEQISFEPALAQVLAEHLHHPAVGRDMVVGRQDLARSERAVGDLEHGVQPVGSGLVRAEDAEILCCLHCAASRRAESGQ